MRLRRTFSLRMVRFALLPWGHTMLKYRSVAIETRVKTEVVAPTHAKVPFVSTKHNTLPVSPPG